MTETQVKKTPPFRVLSIDGGGVRGLYTAVLLEGLAKRIAAINQKPDDRLDVGRAFNLIVGTSTGAILATALAAGTPLEEIIHLYKTKASAIFADPTPTKRYQLIKWMFRNRQKAANDPSSLNAALKDVLGDETVAELYARRGIALCIPAVNIETQKSWVYKTPHDNKDHRLQRDNDYRLVDVCMSSAAAPIVFPVHGVTKPKDTAGTVNWFVDGGLWANNPVIVALIEALCFAPADAEIQLISVSTCPPFKATSIDEGCFNRGVLGWHAGIRMLEVAIDAQSWAYDYMAKSLASQLDGRIKYIRLADPAVNADDAKELRLDNPSNACFRTLAKLGNSAVDLNISEATTGEKPKALLMDILRDLPSVPKGDANV